MAASRRRFWAGVICLRQPSRVAADSQRARIRAKLRSAGWGVSGSATRGSGRGAGQNAQDGGTLRPGEFTAGAEGGSQISGFEDGGLSGRR